MTTKTPKSPVAATRDEALVLDVRTVPEFRGEHLPGSINAPLADLERFRSELEPWKERPVRLLCRTGRRAETARRTLEGWGFTRLEVMPGGIVAIDPESLERGRPGMSIERQVRVAAGAMVAVGTALGVALSPWFLVVPAFVGCGLVFAGLTDTCGMAMMLARLPFNRVTKLQVPSCSTR